MFLLVLDHTTISAIVEIAVNALIVWALLRKKK